MKKVLTLALAVVALSVFTGLATAGTTINSTKSNTFRAAPDNTSTKLMTGKVTEVNNQDNTFTVMAKGKQHTFVANNFKTLPKVGEILDITYTQAPGEPAKAINLNSSKSNSY